jgi:hypothetical protein
MRELVSPFPSPQHFILKGVVMSTRPNLLEATTQLEQALAAPATDRGDSWRRRMEQALAQFEEAVRQHSASLAASGGKLVDVDRPLLPSPGVDHHVDRLREELKSFLEETQRLRGRVSQVVPPDGPASAEGIAGALSVAPELGAIPDFGIFCKRGRSLVEALQHYEQEEAELILRSVNTDIGAGD